MEELTRLQRVCGTRASTGWRRRTSRLTYNTWSEIMVKRWTWSIPLYHLPSEVWLWLLTSALQLSTTPNPAPNQSFPPVLTYLRLFFRRTHYGILSCILKIENPISKEM
ncbi:hypothetical protein O6P43_019764 [Quillaja saponaria]|uniref:Uncharacterized protein n=1 Tax=Quillaja saponaria TaxID=32244 RepID=A0AAD7LJQ4_QUISA|nr:hypothetical protein O6P43_019764 [Quillaja saponaria]